MERKLYRKLIALLVILGITTSNVLPTQTFAAEQNIKTSLQQQNHLGAGEFQDVMEKNASSVLVMDSYAHTILEQKEVSFDGINSINHELKTSILVHQKDTRTNATYWLSNMKPHMMQVNNDIVNYSVTFQTYYNDLVTAINQHDTNTLKMKLEELHHSILNNKKKTDELLNELISFRNKMTVDTQNLKRDVDGVTTALTGQDMGIPLLQQQINQYNDLIKKSNDMIIVGGVLCAMGILCIAGGPMIAEAKKNISYAEQEIRRLQSKITESQAEVVNLTNLKNQVSYLSDTIDVAITSLQNISNQWHTIGAKYNNVLQNVEFISPADFVFIKEDLNVAKDSWKDLEDYAKKLNEGTRKMEKGL